MAMMNDVEAMDIVVNEPDIDANATINVMTCDGEMVVVNKRLIFKYSSVIKDMVSDMTGDDIVPLANINVNEFKKIITFCEFMEEHPQINVKDYRENLKITNDFLDEFTGKTDCSETKEQCNLFSKANFLNVKPLVRVMAVKLASMVKNMSDDEIRNFVKY
jgi:hypothetical protein